MLWPNENPVENKYIHAFLSFVKILQTYARKITCFY